MPRDEIQPHIHPRLSIIAVTCCSDFSVAVVDTSAMKTFIIDHGLVEIPDWVNGLAQDADGTWWGYSCEPLAHESGWYENEVGQSVALNKGSPDSAWKQHIYKIVNK